MSVYEAEDIGSSPIKSTQGDVSQLAEEAVLETVKCWFDSIHPYKTLDIVDKSVYIKPVMKKYSTYSSNCWSDNN